MSTYIILINWTEQGIRTVKESPQRLATAKKVIEAAGGKITDFYLTVGRYDMIAIAEAPSDETMATLILGLGSGGGIRTETVKAFSEEQYRDIILLRFPLIQAAGFKTRPINRIEPVSIS